MKAVSVMAKKSRRRVSVGQGRAAGGRATDLFTATERKLLAESSGASLESADRAAVLDRLKRGRGLRDKWRDLAGRQTRKGKRAPQLVAEANVRSHDKAALLQDAVTRLEKRLAALEGAARPASGRPAVKPTKSVTKRSRVAAHRATRAGVRAALAEKAADLNRGRPQTPKAEPAAVVVPAPAADLAKAAKSSRAVGTRRQPRTAIVAPVGGAPRTVRADRSQQRSARAGAKQARLAIKGVSTRRGGHVLASGKRAQARRDKRSR